MNTVMATGWRLTAGARALAPAVVACLAGVLAVSGCALVVSARAAGGCPNEAVREEQGSAALALPECRGYELVTPPGVHPNVQYADGGYVSSNIAVLAEVSVSGDAAVYQSWYSPSASPSAGHFFRSVRTGDGWLSEDISPALGPKKENCADEYMYFSPSLMGQILETEPQGTRYCGAPEPPLVPGEPRGVSNVLVRAEGAQGYLLANVAPEGTVPTSALFQGASPDLSHVFFTEEAPLVEDAPAGKDLYVWDEGSVRLVTYLPDGEPVDGSLADRQEVDMGNGNFSFANSWPVLMHAVSDSGERAVFEYGGALYLRENAARAQSRIVVGSGAVNGEQCAEPEKACTVQLDAVQGVSGAGGGGEFWDASANDSRVFFTDANRLTPDATAVTGKPDLYEYDVETGVLTDLTPDAASYPANVQGVAGVSQDGAYVYFVADGVLTENASGRGVKAVVREPNLYLWHAGVTTFVATLNPGDSYDWASNGSEEMAKSRSTEISWDGEFLAFNSVMPLTEYDNEPVAPEDCKGTYLTHRAGEPCNEIFMYDAVTNQLSCVSCGPPQSVPSGLAELRESQGSYPDRALAPDGSVFFDTPSALSAQDSNGVSDVYEWSPVGVGGCEASSVSLNPEANGCQYLISSGTSSEPSYFVDASESGEDAFFVSDQALVGAATDESLNMYDARVNGGFTGSGHVVERPGCGGEEECRSPLGESPAQSLPGSVTFAGSGNVVSVVHQQAGGEPKQAHKLTRSQKLSQALAKCRKEPESKRKRCEAAARKRLGVKVKAKTKRGHAREKGGRR